MGIGRARAGRRAALTCASVALMATASAGCAQQGDVDSPTPSAKHTVITHAGVPLPDLPHHVVAWPAPKMRVVGNTIELGGRTRKKNIHVRATTKVRTFDVSPLRADTAVSTRGGVYFLNAGELWFLAPGGARSTGFVGLMRVVSSADGRYLGFVDRNHGPARPGNTQLAAAVVYDVTTGKVVLRSSVGMGSTSEDLEKAYATDPPVPLLLRGRVFFVSTPHGTYRYPLSGARPTKVSS